MKERTTGLRNGIQWTLEDQLEDLDIADDLAILAHTHTKLEAISSKLGLKINTDKTKTIRINSNASEQIMINNLGIEDVTSFTYLGSIINITGRTGENILARIGKAHSTFNTLASIWRSREITTTNKIRIFNSNIKSVLLYGSETWRMIEKRESKLQTFINRCLRRILGIYWPATIINANLWEATGQEPVRQEMTSRKWT